MMLCKIIKIFHWTSIKKKKATKHYLPTEYLLEASTKLKKPSISSERPQKVLWNFRNFHNFIHLTFITRPQYLEFIQFQLINHEGSFKHKKIIYCLYPKESWRNNLCRSQDWNRCELDLSLLLFHFHCRSSVGRSGFLSDGYIVVGLGMRK